MTIHSAYTHIETQLLISWSPYDETEQPFPTYITKWYTCHLMPSLVVHVKFRFVYSATSKISSQLLLASHLDGILRRLSMNV